MMRVRLGALTGAATDRVLHAGNWTASVPCALAPNGKLLGLPPAILEDLGLYPGDEVNAMEQEGGRHLYIGPVIGILLSPKGVSLLHGAWAEYYRQMAREARLAGALPIFMGVEGVDAGSGRVHGWVDRCAEWEEASLPLPDVLYNRATYSDPKRRAAAAAGRRELVNLFGAILLNEANSFSKWEVCEALRFFPLTAPLLPETIRFDDLAALAGMLARHARVYVKTDHGSHGTDVLRLVSGPDGWAVTGQYGGRPVTEKFARPEQLYTFLSLLHGSARAVVQQGIHLPEVEGRIFDLRAFAQKDGQGEWTAPLVLVRWARPGSVAANMSQGGEPFLPAAFLSRYGSHLPGLAGMESAAAAVARKVATALEARFGRLGEVGVDIGVDREGRLWVFEANTKPIHPQLPGLPVPLTRNPMRYAVYLAGRKWSGLHAGLPGPFGPT